ncbi:unnamed protein product [Psylliodes chrysocephalus]|uniref:Anamorsin homolog n=1 Tax=Psylliodes chrysocephalus TaxID=3402493 RepID=A0A9P0GDS1_9CUCU|nr:unnamed protein product [Psylliodes chrysocephala]
MDFLSDLSSTEEILVIESINRSESFNKILEHFKNSKIIPKQDISKYESVVAVYCEAPESTLISSILKILASGGKIIIRNADEEKTKLELITKGFVNIKIFDNIVTAFKPNYASGSSVPLKLLKKEVPAVWKLDDGLEDDVETIDPNDLLDDDDLQKPDPASLRVCGTTGKRKACKDCSCGLADELATEGKIIDTKDAPKSSCGSCYLGDAFRCASCPYLGMPAFKPGEKIQLVGNQLQADI